MSDEALFHEARKLVPADRAAYLEANCADQEARHRIEELLRVDECSGGILDQPALTGAPRCEPDQGEFPAGEFPAAEMAGTVIGPYKLLQKLGEGGMGSVWVAEQSAPVKRRVALKVTNHGHRPWL
jgi:serine/threonine protein kinase